jgi:beta-lactamase regulating signal transducer with metallopeptidase domain
LTEWLQLAAAHAAAALVPSVWQGIALASAVWLCLRLLPRIPARTRFQIWFVTFFLLAVLPLAGLLPALDPAAPGSALAPPSGAHPLIALSPLWAVGIFFAWMAATIAQLALLAWDVRKLRMLRRRSQLVDPSTLATDLQVALAAGRARPVELRLSGHADSPSVIGFFRPAIVLPRWVHEECSPAEMVQIVLHETAHLGRRDDWTNLLQKLARALNPLNPALYWVEKRLCFEREVACDDAVLDAEIPAREYATCLVTLAGRRIRQRQASLAPGAIDRQSDLGRRVGNILAPIRRSSRLVRVAAALVFTAVAASAGVGFMHCPQLVVFTAPVLNPPALAANDVPRLPHTTLEEARFPQPHLTNAALHLPAKPHPATGARNTHASAARHAERVAASERVIQAAAHPVEAMATSRQPAQKRLFVVFTLSQDMPQSQLHITSLVFTRGDGSTPVLSVHEDWFYFQI